MDAVDTAMERMNDRRADRIAAQRDAGRRARARKAARANRPQRPESWLAEHVAARMAERAAEEARLEELAAVAEAASIINGR